MPMTTTETTINITTTTTDSLRWLHLTDLHVGKGFEPQNTALASLVAAVDRFARHKPFDVVFITGDLAFSGNEKEYENFEKQIISPLRNLSICKDAIFIATPGNHDLDCDVGLPAHWESLGSKRQSAFFNFDEDGKRIRKSRADAFKNYSDYIAGNNILSVDPVNYPAKKIRIKTETREYVIVSVVSTYFSDKDNSDYQKSPAPTHPLRTLLQSEGDESQKILLSHYPIDWFTQETERVIHSLIQEFNALYLYGHEHKVKAVFGRLGLNCLGFGAAYQNSLDAKARPYYKNSFTICELSDELHVHVVSWDSENGRWISDLSLPADFSERSELIQDGFTLPLPSTRLASKVGKTYSTIASSIKTDVRIESSIWTAVDDIQRWTSILSQIGQLQSIEEIYALPTQTMAAGHKQFRVKDRRGNFFVYVVSGAGDILNYDQLVGINTELDKQAYDGCVVATLGTLSDEASTLAAQLSLKKKIVVLQGEDLTKEIVKSSSTLYQLTKKLSPPDELARLLILDKDFAMVVEERVSGAWFKVLSESGDVIAESDDIVLKVRTEVPHLQTTRYSGTEAGTKELPLETGDPSFNRELYLERSFQYFDDVKYAPLAALGFRFRKASLSEIYVSASADVNEISKSSQNASRAISEYMESLNLPKNQRDQLESQVRSRLGIETGAEVGAARQLYQRYNNIVVMGDPGSGKTCFVKNEILAYCRPPSDQGSWYKAHLPIYVSLAEAARLLTEKSDIISICSTVSSRRGIDLPEREIFNALSNGKAAFFFDGLDEVGYVDVRISLVSQISDLIERYSAQGNRFVLSTRPAALVPVDIPEVLTSVQLKGLADEEIRTLAGRVLTVRLGGDESQDLTEDEVALIDRLIDDTRNSPGVARIAKNPLLLTLLVLIYANAGSIGARRHVIYTQAIKTLVSVRGRETREQQISEADLRLRLGAIASSIFKRKIAEIPRKSEVYAVLSAVMFNSKNIDSSSILHMSGFLQEVSEATGLISIHSDGVGNEDDALITFMHYSFLEYYAASGLLSNDYLGVLPEVADNPRWKDVITLLFGILSEQGDVTPALRSIINNPSASESVTNARLLLALECAAECDVPPEAAQHALFEALYKSLSSGAARFSSELRDSIASRLTSFLQGTGRILEAYLCKGLSDADGHVVAAFVDLIARLSNAVTLPDSIVNLCEKALSIDDQVTRSAVLFGILKRAELRGDSFKNAVNESLKGSLSEKHAALDAVNTVPAYYSYCSTAISDLLDDSNALIASAAARCILICSFGTAHWISTPSREEKILMRLTFAESENNFDLPGISIDSLQIERMVSSGTATEKELAVRYSPMLRTSPATLYNIIIRTLKSAETSRIKSACLDSLRASPRAIDLITIADTDLICQCVDAQERNVQIAALKLLGDMPDDEQVVKKLTGFIGDENNNKTNDDQINAAVKALSKHAKRNTRLKNEVTALLLKRIPKNPSAGFGDSNQQRQLLGLLTICEELGDTAQAALASRLMALAESFKTPAPLRRQAIRSFGAVAPRTPTSVESLISLLKKNSVEFNDATYYSTLAFVNACKRKVQSIRSVYSELPKILETLEACWRREIASSVSIDPSGAHNIREAVVGIRDVISQYDEFAVRASLAKTGLNQEFMQSKND